MTDVFLCQNGSFVQHLLSFADSRFNAKSRVSLKAAFEYVNTQLDPLISERVFIGHADFDLFKSVLKIFDTSDKKPEPSTGLAFGKPGRLRLPFTIAVDQVQLLFEPEFPESLIFSKSAVSKYQLLARHILRLSYLNKKLSEISCSKRWHRTGHLTLDFVHIFKSQLIYVMQDVLKPNLTMLLEQISLVPLFIACSRQSPFTSSPVCTPGFSTTVSSTAC